eukprot:6249303-Prymnesium_polylepis.1
MLVGHCRIVRLSDCWALSGIVGCARSGQHAAPGRTGWSSSACGSAPDRGSVRAVLCFGPWVESAHRAPISPCSRSCSTRWRQRTRDLIAFRPAPVVRSRRGRRTARQKVTRAPVRRPSAQRGATETSQADDRSSCCRSDRSGLLSIAPGCGRSLQQRRPPRAAEPTRRSRGAPAACGRQVCAQVSGVRTSRSWPHRQ